MQKRWKAAASGNGAGEMTGGRRGKCKSNHGPSIKDKGGIDTLQHWVCSYLPMLITEKREETGKGKERKPGIAKEPRNGKVDDVTQRRPGLFLLGPPCCKMAVLGFLQRGPCFLDACLTARLQNNEDAPSSTHSSSPVPWAVQRGGGCGASVVTVFRLASAVVSLFGYCRVCITPLHWRG